MYILTRLTLLTRYYNCIDFILLYTFRYKMYGYYTAKTQF